jgi:uncharacterized membrane protein YfcA
MNWVTKITLQVLSVGGIAGVIGIIIAGTICARYFMHGNEEIPQILSYALTTIIGFYFGSKAENKPVVVDTDGNPVA